MLRCQEGSGSVPICHVQCYLLTATRAARRSGHAGGLPPRAISPHPTHCNPGKAPWLLPLSAFPLAGQLWAGGGSCAPGCEPIAPPLTPKCASSGPQAPTLPPDCAPAPWPRVTTCLCAATASSRGTLRHPASSPVPQQPPPHASSCPSPSETPPPGWPGPGSGCGCLAGMAPCLLSPRPTPGTRGLVRVTQSRRGTESTVMGARLLHP